MTVFFICVYVALLLNSHPVVLIGDAVLLYCFLIGAQGVSPAEPKAIDDVGFLHEMQTFTLTAAFS